MKLITCAAAITVSLLIAGCGGKLKGTTSGAGLTTTISGAAPDKKANATFYGHEGDDQKLGFIIFTDFDEDKWVGTVRGDWWGEIGPKGGKPVMAFERHAEGIRIGGTDYDFENGRVFLATAPEKKLKIEQVEILFEDRDPKAEVERIAKEQVVQDFLNQPGEDEEAE